LQAAKLRLPGDGSRSLTWM